MIYSSGDDSPTDLNSVKVMAILLNTVSYTKCRIQGEIQIPADTTIYVDIENSIALIGNDHIHIDSHEYRIFES